MTSNSRKSYSLDVEAFSLSDGETCIDFQLDNDLYVGVDRALGNDPDPRKRRVGAVASQAALVLIELGIDGSPQHRVRLERTGNIPGPGESWDDYDDVFNYPRGGEAFILGDAIEACQAVLDQLLAMRTADEVRDSERSSARCTCPEGQRCSCGFNERMSSIFFGDENGDQS